MNNEDINNFTKKEFLSGITVYPILKYLEELFGYKEMIRLVEPIGLSVSYLLNNNNWISFEYYNLLLEKLVESTKDEEAPYKVFLNLDKKVIKHFLSAAYPANLFNSLDLGYDFVFNFLIHKWISKVGDFKILFSKRSSFEIELRPKQDYEQTRYICLSLKGFLIYLVKAYGFLSPKIKEKKYFKLNDNICSFKIIWKHKKDRGLTLSIFTAISIFGVNVFLFINNILNINQFLYNTLLTVVLFLLVNKILDIIRNKKNIITHVKKDISIIGIIEKIEKEFNKQILKETELEEKNKYLVIVNHLRKLINSEIYFNPVLFGINKILINEFNFYKGAYFNFDNKTGDFILNFELENKSIIKNDSKEINLSNTKFSMSQYLDFKELNYPLYLKEFNKSLKLDSNKVLNKFKTKNNDLIYMIPIEISEINLGFLFLFSYNKLNISDRIIKELFETIKDQLEIGFQKIFSRNVVENILSSVPAYVLIFNIDNLQIRYVNNILISSFPDIAGKYTRDDIIGMELFDLSFFTEEDKKNIKKFIKKSSSKRDIERHEIKSSSYIIEYNLFLISQYKESERLAGIIFNDLTDAEYFQQHLLNNEKLISLGKIASGVAHEINNPLYAILANAEEINENKNIDKNLKKYAEEIIEYVMNVSNIIKDLSIYSKTLRREKLVNVDLNTVIEDSLKLVTYSSNFIEIKVTKNLSKIPLIKTTKGEMQQVFINLFNNAAFAMDGRGSLVVSSNYKDKKIIISVIDTGQGIAEEDQDHIFDLFYTTKEPGKGTGQGLHIVRRILEKYDASINFESKINKGTSVQLTFKVK